MGYHIDFLPIGDKSCGDAIVIRFGDLTSSDPTRQSVVLIDGGYSEDSAKILEHIGTYHPNIQQIDLMVSTHLDGDHIAGLPGVIENFDVKELWMHLPWDHSELIKSSRANNFSTSTARPRIIKSLRGASNLAQVAYDNDVPIVEPFYGQIGSVFFRPYGRLTVLGPTKDYYESLVPEFNKSAVSASSPQSILGSLIPTAAQTQTHSILSELTKAMEAIKSATETHNHETLKHGQETNAENNSSVILLLEAYDGNVLKRFLFTGDAGVPALEIAHNNLEFCQRRGSITEGGLSLVQVPHHGSRKNVDPTILNKILGPVTAQAGEFRGSAIVSISQGDCKDGHPKKIVTNAFKRRGYPVAHTRGTGILFHSLADARASWSTAPTLPLFAEVESYDE